MRLNKSLACYILCFSIISIDAFAQSGLRIGAILPLSGDAQSAGEAIRNGMTMGMEELQPEVREKLHITFEDDAMRPTQTVSAFQKLLSSDGIDLVVNASSRTGKALAPIAESAKIPLIAIATNPEVVKNRQYVVNFWITPEEQVRMVIPEIKNRGYHRIARVTSIDGFTLSLKECFDKNNGGQIPLSIDEEVPPETKDFRSVITKIRAQKDVDAIMLALVPGQLGLFAMQTREMKISVPLFGFETFEDSAEIKASHGALLNQWYVNIKEPKDSFTANYKRRFPDASLFGAANGHDIVLLLGKAIESNLRRIRSMNFFIP